MNNLKKPNYDDPIERLVKLLQFHCEWKRRDYTLDHISGLELWHVNGMFSLHVYKPVEIRFSFFEKCRLWPHVRRCMKAVDAGRLENLSDVLDKT